MCNDGFLFFGVLSRRNVPHEGLGLVLASSDGLGAVAVNDGEIELVPGTREAVSGTASTEPGFDSGTFDVHGNNRFIGVWNCASSTERLRRLAQHR